MRIGKVCHFPGCAGRRGPGGGHMFHVKHCRWRGRCSGCRVGLAVGVGGPGTGSGRVDAIGYRPGELHVGECKGGTSAKIGTYEVDRVKVEQGSAAYVGDRLATDVDFHQKMRENPELWEAIKDGRITVHSDIAIARSGNAGRIDFKTVPIVLDPAHITRIDQAIKGH